MPIVIRLLSPASVLISVIERIRALDNRIATWPWMSLADSTQNGYEWGRRHYENLMYQLRMPVWPLDPLALEQNLARFIGHLAAKRQLKLSSIRTYLAGVRLELVEPHLSLKVYHSLHLKTLLGAVEKLQGGQQTRKQPITTSLLCQFAAVLPSAPAELLLGMSEWMTVSAGASLPDDQ